MLKSCSTCQFGTNHKEIRGIHYVVCKNPCDYKGPMKAKLGLECWTERK
jgi:hypothetical protein